MPGLALVVVHDDRIVHLAGYGSADLAAKTPMTPDTIVPLASCTKPFNATMLATLVADGKIGWNDPVRNHLETFRLRVGFAMHNTTFRDLLSHRTGLGEQALLWYKAPHTLEERVRRLAYLDPIDDFRANFHYQATAFATTGLVAERVMKTPWQDLVESRVFKKLGMTSSTAIEPTGKAAKLLAEPYKMNKDGVVEKTPRYTLDQPDPAGSVHSTARDLGVFLRMCLAEGAIADSKTPLLPPEIFRHMHDPVIPIPIGGLSAELNPESVQISYGMGWIIQDYRGKKMVLHGGAIDGFRAHLVFLPQVGVAVGVLSNLDNSLGNFALANSIVDRYLEAPPRDWNATARRIEDAEKDFDAKHTKHLRTVVRRPGDVPPRPLKDYVGEYDDSVLGTFKITLEKDHLVATLGSLTSPLEHLREDAFLADTAPFHNAMFVFFTLPNRGIAELRAADRSFLKQK